MSKWVERGYSKVIMATRAGILPPLKEVPCETCGMPSEAKHHPDYNKPLEVNYLCRKCHRGLHKKLGWGIAGRPKIKAEYNFEDIPVGHFAIIENEPTWRIALTSKKARQNGMKLRIFSYNGGSAVFREK